ncbi:RloB family protein [Arthrobacter sp. NPDC090010]|uniref:RloB family protein n=1 Tax=Arthrobacter sp. NPDC090010 TaxID=3363942 RepID=UPI0038192E1B
MAGRAYGRRSSRPARELVRRILVVTEGMLTERQYVEGLNSFLRSKGATAVVKSVPVGKDPLKVVQKCVEKRDEAAKSGKEYEFCVCLVDVDQHDALPAACQLAASESIVLLISNLKFEVWLRWHAENKRSAMTSSQLDELTNRLGLVKNKSLSSGFPFHAVHGACKVARTSDPGMEAGRVGPDPSSAMPILVDLMLASGNK